MTSAASKSDNNEEKDVKVSKYFVDEELVKRQIAETDLNNGFIVAKLMERMPIFRERIQKHKIKEIATNDISEVNGFTSNIIRFAVTFAEETDEDEANKFNVILKMFSVTRLKFILEKIGIGTETRILERLMKVHNRECDFYEMVAPRNSIPTPRIFYTQKLDVERSISGLIIMEDLGASACMVPMEDGLSVEQVETIVGHLVDFHKNLLLDDEEKTAEWKSAFTEFMFGDEDISGGFERIFKEVFEKDRELEKLLRRLQKTATREFAIYSLKDCAKELDLPELIVHGDMWTNNLLWHRDKQGQASSEVAAFIDWQIIFTGNFFLDIARVIVLCTSPEIRHQLEPYIVRYYYEHLVEALRDTGRKPTFTLAQAQRAYDFAAVNQAVFGAILVPFFEKAMANNSAITKEELDAKIATLLARSKAAITDALSLMERIAPEWLIVENSAEKEK